MVDWSKLKAFADKINRGSEIEIWYGKSKNHCEESKKFCFRPSVCLFVREQLLKST